jgi:hypothetical protein
MNFSNAGSRFDVDIAFSIVSFAYGNVLKGNIHRRDAEFAKVEVMFYKISILCVLRVSAVYSPKLVT